MTCKNCKLVMKVPRGKDFICGGLCKPTKYKGDKIKLCLRGKFVDSPSIELTPMECCIISAVLSACASHFAEH